MRRFSIRNKLFISFSMLGLIALGSSSYLAYSNAQKSLVETIHNQLNNSTTLITNLVHSVASTSIENHLKAIADTQLVMISGIYDQYRSGLISESEAKKLAAKLLLKQDIGSSGYLYCVNSFGNVTVHRDKQVENSNVLDYGFVRQQVQLKTGYIEYRWKNPGEPQERDKALYMSYFKPWDWIISATAYKNDFTYLIDLDKIRKALRKVGFGETGYPYIVSNSGDYIYHPHLTGNLYSSGLDQASIRTVEKIIQQRHGPFYYQWQNREDPSSRKKISIINYLPDYNWIVGSSAYLDELYQPLSHIQKVFLWTFLVYALVILAISYGLSTLFTSPLKTLTSHFKDQDASDVQPITARFSNDEVGQLASYLNQFIAKLSEHHLELEAEISERKRSEKALRASEQTFHTLFDHSFQFIALLAPDCRVHKINQTALDFRNLKASDVVGEYFWNTPWWRHSETLIRQLKDAHKVALAGQVGRFEAHSTAVREIYLDISLKPVLDDANQVIYIVAEARDVTDIRRAEHELQQAQKMESVGTLAGGIAHDFNNILGGILGTLALLKLKREKGTPIPEDKLFDHLNTVTETAMRAKDIVTQLLTLSRKYDLKFTPVNLATILEQTCQIARTSFDKSITIDARLEEQVPVDADGNSLEQVFLNICINAAHAMTIMRPPGESWGGTLCIGLEKIVVDAQIGRTSGDYWRVSISDSGAGIDPANLKQIFVPFFTTKTKDAGSGLGLSMVYNIIKQHKGFIDVESQKGFGTTFHVYLPVGTLDQVANIAEKLEPALTSGEGLILVIDDEELIRNSACEMLEECGYRVMKAENGKEGIDLYRRHQAEISAVLLDLVMPLMSGQDTFATLKKLNPAIKVLLSSGFRHDARVDEILDAGATDFIQKPYSLYDLSYKINRILS